MTKKQATREANTLKAVLGKGWTTRVWKNLDQWCYAVYCGNLEIYPGCGHYSALLGDTSPHGGNGCWTCPEGDASRNPITAAKKAVKRARTQVNVCLASVAAAEKALGINRVTTKSGSKILPTGWKQTVEEVKVDGKPVLLSIAYKEIKK